MTIILLYRMESYSLRLELVMDHWEPAAAKDAKIMATSPSSDIAT